MFKLNYIPHESLRALLSMLKQSWTGSLAGGVTGTEFGVLALECFHRWTEEPDIKCSSARISYIYPLYINTSFCRMTVHSGLLVEVLSDWGLLELLLGELRKRAKIIRKAGVLPSAHSDLRKLPCVEDNERLLTASMLQVVSNLTLRSIKNTGIHVCGFNNRISCFLILE